MYISGTQWLVTYTVIGSIRNIGHYFSQSLLVKMDICKTWKFVAAFLTYLYTTIIKYSLKRRSFVTQLIKGELIWSEFMFSYC